MMQSNGPGYTRMHVWGMVAKEPGFLIVAHEAEKE